MKAATEPAALAATALRFPVLPIGGLAGTSFKHQHLTAIRTEDKQSGFFEVHAENYMGAGGRRIAPLKPCGATSDLAARRLHVDRRPAAAR